MSTQFFTGPPDNWGTQVVESDNSLLGDGTLGNLLSVNISSDFSNDLSFGTDGGLFVDTSTGSVNIYNSDGALTGNRTVSMGGNNLDFLGLGTSRFLVGVYDIEINAINFTNILGNNITIDVPGTFTLDTSNTGFAPASPNNAILNVIDNTTGEANYTLFQVPSDTPDGLGNPAGTYVWTVDEDGLSADWESTNSFQNWYIADGAMTGNRTVTFNANNILFSGTTGVISINGSGGFQVQNTNTITLNSLGNAQISVPALGEIRLVTNQAPAEPVYSVFQNINPVTSGGMWTNYSLPSSDPTTLGEPAGTYVWTVDETGTPGSWTNTDDLGGFYGSEYQIFTAPGIHTHSGLLYNNIINTSTAVLPIGTYKITLSYGWNHGANNRDFESRLEFGGAFIGEGVGFTHKQRPYYSGGTFDVTNSIQRFQFTKVYFYNVTVAGAQSVLFGFRPEPVPPIDIASVWDVSIEVVRVA